MQINIQKIVRALPLADYASEYKDAALQVWVNPPKALKDEMQASIALTESLLRELRETPAENSEKRQALAEQIEGLGAQIRGWLSELWSQGAELTRMSLDDVNALVADCSERDPALYRWLVRQTWSMILEHQAGIKKNWKPT